MKWIRKTITWQFGFGLLLGTVCILLICRLNPNRLSGRLLYVKYTTFGGVYSVDVDGFPSDLLTRYFVTGASSPVWSPDGERIAFECHTNAWANLCIMGKDGVGSPIQAIRLIDKKKLPSGFCYEHPEGDGVFINSVSWAPEGERLAFTCGTVEDESVCIIDLEGDVECWSISSVLPVEDVGESVVSWSPTKERLMVSFSDRLVPKVYLVDPDGQNGNFLLEGIGPGWSPDGERIAFFRGDSIYIVNSDGSGLELVYEHEVVLNEDKSNFREWMYSFKLYFLSKSRITWSPDAKYIAFGASRTEAGAESGIYIMNLGTKEITLLTILGDGVFEGADWSP